MEAGTLEKKNMNENKNKGVHEEKMSFGRKPSNSKVNDSEWVEEDFGKETPQQPKPARTNKQKQNKSKKK